MTQPTMTQPTMTQPTMTQPTMTQPTMTQPTMTQPTVPTLLDTLPTEALSVYTAAGVPFGKDHAPVRLGLASFRLELHRGALVLARTLHAPWVPLRADGTPPTWRVAAASRLALDWVRAEMIRPA